MYQLPHTPEWYNGELECFSISNIAVGKCCSRFDDSFQLSSQEDVQEAESNLGQDDKL